MSSRDLLYAKGFDDSVGTYATNYVLVALTAAFAVSLTFFARPLTCSIKRRSHSAIAHFLTAALANLFGGITHQYYPHSQDYAGTPAGFYVFWSGTLVSQAFSIFSMLLFVGPIQQCFCCKALS